MFFRLSHVKRTIGVIWTVWCQKLYNFCSSVDKNAIVWQHYNAIVQILSTFCMTINFLNTLQK